MRASPSRAGRAITWRRPIAMGETQHAYALQVLARLLGGSETSRLWRALVVDAQARARRPRRATARRASASRTFELSASIPRRSSPMAEVESAVGRPDRSRLLDDGVTAEEVERAQNRLLAAAIYSQDSLASGPRTLRLHARTGGTIGRHRRLAAAHRRRHAGRRRGRRAPCLARRRRGDLAADAGRRAADERCCSRPAGSACRVGAAGCRPPARSTSRQSPRRSASRPGWSRTRARRSWRCPSPSPAAAASDPEGQKGVTSLMATLLTDGAGSLACPGLPAAPGGCRGVARLRRLARPAERHRCACCRPTATRASSCCGSR